MCEVLKLHILSRCLKTHQCYKVNATSWLGPLYLVLPIYGYIMPTLMSITSIFNTIIMVVLTRPKMRTATNTVLLGMAMCDMMTILLPSPFYLYYFTLGHHHQPFWSPTSCFLFEHGLETLPQLFHSASNWLTLVLALQRYIFVCRPTLAKSWCTINTVMNNMEIKWKVKNFLLLNLFRNLKF